MAVKKKASGVGRKVKVRVENKKELRNPISPR